MATQSPYTNTTENITAVTSTVHLKPNTAVIAVVVTLIVLTVILLSVLLYHYMCHNKGDYRTTGELAPGEDLDEDSGNQTVGEKKEYFI
ncbi:small cell adhesion glycoprotein-like isoform X2 [Hippocampus zosterae]|nr:small cell adhesion glycoprotein-like isoform X2 [Hippocampus zosterae]XP_051915553.1 small cell adhesion glycoprotein-like isoform X2 [Hippocampus zosterae]